MPGTQQARRRPGDVAIRSSPAALFALLAGCVSYSYVDDRNIQHVVGIVDVAVGPANASPSDSTASGVSVTSFGLSPIHDPIPAAASSSATARDLSAAAEQFMHRPERRRLLRRVAGITRRHARSQGGAAMSHRRRFALLALFLLAAVKIQQRPVVTASSIGMTWTPSRRRQHRLSSRRRFYRPD